MYGDTTVIRRLAVDLRDQAVDIRGEADGLVARTDAVGWLGVAGDALRRRAEQRALVLRRSAALHDEAADALERHAREVERRQRLIEEIERRVRHLVDAARGRLADVAQGWADGVANGLRHLMPDAADEWLDRFDPPPSGSRRWLEVEVPGL